MLPFLTFSACPLSLLLTVVCPLPEHCQHPSSRCLHTSSPSSASHPPSNFPFSASPSLPAPLLLPRCVLTSGHGQALHHAYRVASQTMPLFKIRRGSCYTRPIPDLLIPPSVSQLEHERKRRAEEHRALLKHKDALKINELREINEHAEKMMRLETIAQGKSLAFDKIERAPNER